MPATSHTPPEQTIMARRLLLFSLITLGLIAAAIAAFLATGEYVAHLRFQDADPALSPLLPLRVEILSNPCGFNRYCNFIVEFPPDTKLSDENTAELVCLGKLPDQYRLDLFIRTQAVTDLSLPQLKKIRRLDGLDVTESAISNAGIAELRGAFPKASVIDRNDRLRWAGGMQKATPTETLGD
jgi:hypothetical protein